MLDPELDLWTTAKPYLERWMNDQIGPASLKRRLISEAPYIVAALPELPRLIHQWLLARPKTADDGARELAAAQRARNRWLAFLAALLVLVAALLYGRPL
jgi:ubiquinone biosynthesis protein